jgi:hypothetical protein
MNLFDWQSSGGKGRTPECHHKRLDQMQQALEKLEVAATEDASATVKGATTASKFRRRKPVRARLHGLAICHIFPTVACVLRSTDVGFPAV